MDILTNFVGKVLDFTLEPVRRQFGYVLFYSSNIKRLQKDAEKLNATRKDVESMVRAAQDNNEEISENVQLWKRDVDEIIQKAERFFEEDSHAKTGCSHRSCPNIWSRYKLSREAKNMATEVGELNEQGNFQKVSIPRKPPESSGHSSAVREAFQSRVSIMNEILEALPDPAIQVIGLCGPGGVGKTTLANQVVDKARDEKLFDKVLFVEVKQNQIKDIQTQIASMLRLHFDTESENVLIVRANRLRQRLKEEKSLLVVLDDLWERLDFDQIGIPTTDMGNTHCKFLLTSRNADLLSSQMNCKRNIMVRLLSEKEAWVLFKGTAEINENSDDRELVSKADEVCRKCAQLPVAIVAVARALRNNKSLVVWKDALQRLKSYSGRNISGIDEVDSCIKLSYDYLKPELKSTFLLSAMFSQDPLIMDLFMYAFGLGYLEGVHNMEAARNRLDALVHQLKASSLLLDSYSEDRFTIHDVVRDVTLSIAVKEQHALVKRHEKVDEWPNEDQLKNCTAICLDQSDIDELPRELFGPKVEFFFLESKDPKLNIPSSFFNGMQELKVLSLSNLTFSSLPSSISHLSRLITLSLHSCMLKDITGVERLKQLQILNLSHSRIKQLPCEVGQLSCLKILNLSSCHQLEAISPNILSNLKKLEQLLMKGSFNKWEAEGLNEGKERASLDEIKHLKKLSVLEIEILDASVLPKDLFLENSLQRYKIFIGDSCLYFRSNEFSKTLSLVANNKINMEYGVFRLFENVEDLNLEKLNGITSLYQSDITTQTFCKLRAVRVRLCDRLKSLFSVSMVGILSRLERIEVFDCKSLEEIVMCIDEENVEKKSDMNFIEFLQLRSLKLNGLPVLTDFCFNNKVAFPNLETLYLQDLNCQNIWDIFTSKSSGTHISEIVESSQKRIVSNGTLPDRSFSNLKTLIVRNCEFLLNLIPLHILKSLSNLEELEITSCVSLEVVFDFGEFNNYNETHIFPLKTLFLAHLPKLKTVWRRGSQGINNKVAFPNLETLILRSVNCQNIWDMFTSTSNGTQISEIVESSHMRILRNDPLGDWSFSNLKTFKVEYCDLLLKLIPFHILKSLSNLEVLEIRSCVSLEVVFDFGEFNNYKETHTFRLKKLILENLSKLKTVWGRGFQGIVSFQSLQQISVQRCQNLKSVFPVCIAKGLVQLEELEISNCGTEFIVAKDEFPLEVDATFVFPNLRKLEIWNCNQLETFQSELPDTKYSLFFDDKVIPKLEELGLNGRQAMMMCNGKFRAYNFFNVKLLSLSGIYDEAATFPYGLFCWFPKLEELEVSFCSFEAIFFCSERPLDNHTQKTTSIERLKLSFMNRLKHIWDGKCQVNHILQNVKALEVYFCDQLINLGSSFVSLENLTDLNVSSCGQLINLLTPSTARTLVQLTRLKITRCRKIEEIITNGEEDVEKEIVFMKLKILKLRQLPSCKSFCCHNYNFKFPLLDEVIIIGCLRFKMFCLGDLTTPLLKGVEVEDNEIHWQSNLNKTIQQLFDKEVALFRAVELKIDEFPELIDIWNGKLAISDHSFSNLTSLVVDKCDFISNHVIPSFVLTSLIKLQSLRVSNCDSVEVVFDLEGIDIEKEAHTLQAVCLRDLRLDHLPNLKYVWNKDPHTIHCFQHLCIMSAYECESLRSIFPTSIAKGLTKLEWLNIKSCGVEVIVAEDQIPKQTIHFAFPQLGVLKLIKLPNLKNFYPRRHTVEWPSLAYMDVKQCEKVKVFSWEDPKITENEAENGVENQYPIFSFEKVVPNLNQLVLNWDHVKMIRNDQFQDGLFDSVCELGLDSFNEGEPLVFPYAFLEKFPKLTNLNVSHSSFKDIFPNHGPRSDLSRKVPLLTSVSLTHLDQLQNIWNEDSHCSRLINLTPSSASFDNLNSLTVSGCHCLDYLLTTSTARSLVHLKKLVIEDCKMMEEIVTNKGKDVEDIIVLKNLYHMELIDLPILKNFCSQTCTFEFPSLANVSIRGCSKMKMFCPGVLATPLLKVVTVEEDEEYCEGNLNKTLEQLFLMKVIPKLEELRLNGRQAMMMCNGKFRAYNFFHVKFLSLSGIYDKAATFPYGLFCGFPKLEGLEVSSCSFEAIFFCSERPLDNDTQKATSIERLKLSSMKRLKHIWDGKCQMNHILQNVKALEVSYCGSLINLGSSFVSLENLTDLDVSYCGQLINLLTPSTARTLVQLTRLKIKRCRKIEEIITNGEEDVEKEIVFMKLKILKLRQLPSCKSFCCYNYNFKFPLLDEVIITECPRFKMFCPGDLTTPLLKGVEVEDNEIHWQSNLNKTIQQRFDKKVALCRAMELKIDEFPELIDIWNGKLAISDDSFSNLTSLTVDKCAFLFNHVIPSYILTSLINLQRLRVSNCDSVEVVFDLEGIDIEKEAHTLQAVCLSVLRLDHLPNVKYVWIRDPHTIHCFQHLKIMSAYECESLRSIFPTSIAKGLTELEWLDIKSCAVEVIVAEDQIPKQTIHFAFPQLLSLGLINLPNLKNFYPRRHTVEWPRLAYMDVRQCKKVKVFSWEDAKITEKEAEDRVENQYPLFSFEKVVSKLNQLVLNKDHVKMIWNDQFQDDLFNGLETLRLDSFIEDDLLAFPYAF